MEYTHPHPAVNSNVIGTHMGQRAKIGYQHWNTPEEVLVPLRAFMPISLDPCSNPHSTVGAGVSIVAPLGDGLEVPWHWYGHTFVNPPYDDQPTWMARAALERHFYDAAHITMLIPASTETVAFQEHVFGSASAICFWRRRLRFLREGAAGTQGNTLPSALVYWGDEPERFAEHFASHGATATEWRVAA